MTELSRSREGKRPGGAWSRKMKRAGGWVEDPVGLGRGRVEEDMHSGLKKLPWRAYSSTPSILAS